MKTERVQAFSDALFAILITILVLDFKIPEYQAGNLFAAVLRQWPTFFAYVLTYVYIGVLWLFHHDLFSSVKVTTIRLNIINLFSIFLTTLLSYSTSLLARSLSSGNETDLRFAIAFYALITFGISLSYFIFYRYLSVSEEILCKQKEASDFRRVKKYPVISTVIYLMAFTLVFINVGAGLLLLMAGTVFHCFAYWWSARI